MGPAIGHTHSSGCRNPVTERIQAKITEKKPVFQSVRIGRHAFEDDPIGEAKEGSGEQQSPVN